jgi:tRNA(adenine34) deaminase
MDFMSLALEQAVQAAAAGEVPVGAILVSPEGEMITRAGNQMRQLNDPTAHAEILVIRQAAEILGSERLVDCDLYVTLEPCTMCAGAISHARIRRLYYGASDPKTGAVDSGIRFFDRPSCHHRPEVYGGIGETHSSKLLRDFFKMRRNNQKI